MAILVSIDMELVDLKNIYAIIAGISTALSMENTKGMMITRALAEMTRLL